MNLALRFGSVARKYKTFRFHDFILICMEVVALCFGCGLNKQYFIPGFTIRFKYITKYNAYICVAGAHMSEQWKQSSYGPFISN